MNAIIEANRSLLRQMIERATLNELSAIENTFNEAVIGLEHLSLISESLHSELIKRAIRAPRLLDVNMSQALIRQRIEMYSTLLIVIRTKITMFEEELKELENAREPGEL